MKNAQNIKKNYMKSVIEKVKTNWFLWHDKRKHDDTSVWQLLEQSSREFKIRKFRGGLLHADIFIDYRGFQKAFEDEDYIFRFNIFVKWLSC